MTRALNNRLRDQPDHLSRLDSEQFRSTVDVDNSTLEDAYQEIYALARRGVNPRYFAIYEVEMERGVYRRVFSSNPEALPLLDERSLPGGEWTERVLEKLDTIWTNDITACTADMMPDREIALSLDCLSCLYLPVHDLEDNLLGVLLFLSDKDYLTTERVVEANAMYLSAFTYLGTVKMVRDRRSGSA